MPLSSERQRKPSHSRGESPLHLQDQNALVTGAGKRIGRAIALELARAGAHVVIHVNRSLEEGESVAQEIRALGRKSTVVQADQRDVAAIRAACEKAEQELGPVSVLVNSAAIWPSVSIDECTQEDFDLAIEVNLRGPFFWARYLGEAMKKRGSGSIVNIADVTGDRPLAQALPYCISKEGVVSMTYGLAKALAPSVRVNAIGPGPIVFPPDYSEKKKERDLRKTLLGREGGEDSIAQAVRFLCEHEYITGTMLPVDGGFRFGL